MNTRSIPRSLINEVQLFRLRVATAESKLKLLRQEARQARHRRKEAKRIAQRARKRFKRSKSDLAELKQALAKAETKLFQAGARALAKKIGRPMVKRAAAKVDVPSPGRSVLPTPGANS
jgi:hypothetical protein